DLKNYLKDNKLGWFDKVVMCRGILLGLIFCHENGIYHGDVKCSNVLVCTKRVPKLTDFGISRTTSKEYYTSPTGSLFWVAPELLAPSKEETEQFDNDPYPSDVYSLGATFCEVSLDGKNPMKWKEGIDTYTNIKTEDVIDGYAMMSDPENCT